MAKRSQKASTTISPYSILRGIEKSLGRPGWLGDIAKTTRTSKKGTCHLQSDFPAKQRLITRVDTGQLTKCIKHMYIYIYKCFIFLITLGNWLVKRGFCLDTTNLGMTRFYNNQHDYTWHTNLIKNEQVLFHPACRRSDLVQNTIDGVSLPRSPVPSHFFLGLTWFSNAAPVFNIM